MSAPIPQRWQELYAACKDGRYTSSAQQIEAIEQIAALEEQVQTLQKALSNLINGIPTQADWEIARAALAATEKEKA